MVGPSPVHSFAHAKERRCSSGYIAGWSTGKGAGGRRGSGGVGTDL